MAVSPAAKTAATSPCGECHTALARNRCEPDIGLQRTELEWPCGCSVLIDDGEETAYNCQEPVRFAVVQRNPMGSIDKLTFHDGTRRHWYDAMMQNLSNPYMEVTVVDEATEAALTEEFEQG